MKRIQIFEREITLKLEYSQLPQKSNEAWILDESILGRKIKLNLKVENLN